MSGIDLVRIDWAVGWFGFFFFFLFGLVVMVFWLVD